MSRGQRPPPQHWEQRSLVRTPPEATGQTPPVGQPSRPNLGTPADMQNHGPVYGIVPPVTPGAIQARHDVSRSPPRTGFYPRDDSDPADSAHQVAPFYHSPSEEQSGYTSPAHMMAQSQFIQQRAMASTRPSPIEPRTSSRSLGPSTFPEAPNFPESSLYQGRLRGPSHPDYASSSTATGTSWHGPVDPMGPYQPLIQYQGLGRHEITHHGYSRPSPASPSGTSFTAYGPAQGPLLASPASADQSSGRRNRRYSLIVRQQPRAARAGPDGKDRRPVDPPVVVQLQIIDFDPRSEEHLADLRDSFWVVHCALYPKDQSPSPDPKVEEGLPQGGHYSQRRHVLGEYMSQAILSPKDPDPKTAKSDDSNRAHKASHSRSRENIPCVFFIFPDVSVRTPGSYRFRFSLSNIASGMAELDGRFPVVASVVSDEFRVHPAKGFDKVHESTPLIRGLAKLPGAPATLKLKKGPGGRERGKRHRESDSQDSADSN